jgi:hypothetical protein
LKCSQAIIHNISALISSKLNNTIFLKIKSKTAIS